MTHFDLVMESLRLMAIGMGIVFSFLLLLVGILRGMSWLAQRLAPAEPLANTAAVAAAEQGGQSDALIAVISAAIARYRAGR